MDEQRLNTQSFLPQRFWLPASFTKLAINQARHESAPSLTQSKMPSES